MPSISIDKRIKLDITVFLEGAYQSFDLNNQLNQLNEIPLDQPYDVSPWNYNGDESVSEIPPDVVDWILIELRDKNNMDNLIGQRAAFLLSSGKVADIDGNNPVSFLLPEDEYYISVKHRNHLAVMSAEPLLITIPKRN